MLLLIAISQPVFLLPALKDPALTCTQYQRVSYLNSSLQILFKLITLNSPLLRGLSARRDNNFLSYFLFTLPICTSFYCLIWPKDSCFCVFTLFCSDPKKTLQVFFQLGKKRQLFGAAKYCFVKYTMFICIFTVKPRLTVTFYPLGKKQQVYFALFLRQRPDPSGFQLDFDPAKYECISKQVS